MNRQFFHALLRNPYAWVIVISFMFRLTTLGLYPLNDTTEARYGEMARKMVETGNWITPQFDYGVPFWGKPPLSIWVRAASFNTFGINEFAARVPSIFISLGIIFLMFYLARQHLGSTRAWIASALLTTSVLFFILSGAVLMDPLMTLGTMLSMLAFWQAMKNQGRYWGYVFFIGLAIGLMAKGPIAVVLTVIPVVAWLFVSRNWHNGWQRIPLFTGTALMLILSVPWYILAEYTTPGFLDYFIIGEHWNRYTQPGWSGDLYGVAHTSYVGAIWPEWFIAAFPISFILIVALLVLIWSKKSATLLILREDWALYLILWFITPMVVFTFSGNILATYVLPGMPAAALLVAGFGQTQAGATTLGSMWISKSIFVVSVAGVLLPLIYLIAIFFYLPKISEQRSEKFLVEKYRQFDKSKHARLIYLYRRPFSAEFYSEGKAEVISSAKEIHGIFKNDQPVFFAVPANYVSHIPKNVGHCLIRIGRFGRHVLFQKIKQVCES